MSAFLGRRESTDKEVSVKCGLPHCWRLQGESCSNWNKCEGTFVDPVVLFHQGASGPVPIVSSQETPGDEADLVSD